jgi:dTDP-4-dehydrorhamnose reductase
MKVLVIGKNSQLGNTYEKYLLSKNTDKTKFYFLSKNEFNLLDNNQMTKVIGDNDFNLIINFGAYTNVELAEDNRQIANNLNNVCLEALSNFIKNFNIKLIHISTDYVFDGKKNRPYLEEDKAVPLNFYGKTKLEGEKKIINILEQNAYIIRTSWLYSEFKKNFVKTIYEKFQKLNELEVIDDQIGSPTNSLDLIKAIDLIVENMNVYNDFKSGIYHFSNSGECSWYNFANQIGKINKFRTSLVPINSSSKIFKAKRPNYSSLNCGKIEKQYGLTLKPWTESLEEYFFEK